jgi:hypothetical protein
MATMGRGSELTKSDEPGTRRETPGALMHLAIYLVCCSFSLVE